MEVPTVHCVHRPHFLQSKRKGYFRSEASTVRSGQRPQRTIEANHMFYEYCYWTSKYIVGIVYVSKIKCDAHMHLATMSCGGLWPQILFSVTSKKLVPLATANCCAASSCKRSLAGTKGKPDMHYCENFRPQISFSVAVRML